MKSHPSSAALAYTKFLHAICCTSTLALFSICLFPPYSLLSFVHPSLFSNIFLPFSLISSLPCTMSFSVILSSSILVSNKRYFSFKFSSALSALIHFSLLFLLYHFKESFSSVLHHNIVYKVPHINP